MPPLLRPIGAARPLNLCLRCRLTRDFSSTPRPAVSLQWDRNDREALDAVLPAYPHGPTRWYKQARLGLYGGARIGFGNNVGKKIAVKTRRTWKLNVFTRSLYSVSLGRSVQIRVTTRVLRTIDKLGGLDEYLLGEKEMRIKELGESGWWLRWAIMQTPAVKKRFAEERARLGLTEQLAQPAEGDGEQALAVVVEGTPDEVEDAASQSESAPGDVLTSTTTAKDLKSKSPILRFRVGDRKHVMLTPDGWVRAKPGREYLAEHKQGEIVQGWELTRLPFIIEEVEKQLGPRDLKRKDREKIVQLARRAALVAFRKEAVEEWQKVEDRRKYIKVVGRKRRAGRRATRAQGVEDAQDEDEEDEDEV